MPKSTRLETRAEVEARLNDLVEAVADLDDLIGAGIDEQPGDTHMERALAYIDLATLSVRMVLSRMHGMVQLEWTGGGLLDKPSDKEGNYTAPSRWTSELCGFVGGAHARLKDAAHSTVMSIVCGGDAPMAADEVEAARDTLARASRIVQYTIREGVLSLPERPGAYGPNDPQPPFYPDDALFCDRSDTSVHEADHGSFHYGDGPVTQASTVLDLTCIHCGRSGAVLVDHEDIDW